MRGSVTPFVRPPFVRAPFVMAALVLVATPARAQDAGVPDAGDVPDAGVAPDADDPSEDVPRDAGSPNEPPENADARDEPDSGGPDAEDADAGSAVDAGVPEEPGGDDELLGDDELFTLGEEEVDGDDEGEGDGEEEVDGDGDGGGDGGDEGEQSDDEALEDQSVFQLREVVVAYTPEDVFRLGGSAQLLGEEQLQTLEYDDPHDVLLQVPGVYVRTEDGFGLRPNIGIRGGNPERSKKVTLMEDGVLFGPAPYAAPAAYYFPLMARMTGIEVFKGPAALLYGPQTIGGAVNLLTRRIPARPEGGVDVSWGRFRARRTHFHWGTSNRHFGFLFEGLDVGSDGFKEIDGSDRSTGFGRTDFMLRAFAQTEPSHRVFHRLELKLGVGRERSNETYLGLSDADFEEDPNRRYAASELDRMRWWRTQAQLSWRMDVGDHVNLVTTVYRHDFDRSWYRVNRFADGPSLRDVTLTPTGRRQLYLDILRGLEDSSSPDEAILLVDNSRRFVSQGGQTTLRVAARTGEVRHDVEAGLRFHQDQVERLHVEDGYLMRSGSLVPDGMDYAPLTDNLGWAFAFAAYAVYAIEWGGLTVTPGIRTEVVHTRLEDDLAGNTQQSTDAVVLPGIGLQYEVVDHVAVLAGVHRGFSPVAPGQPAEVRPELSVNYELGARYSDSRRKRLLEAIAFLNDYSNLTGQCAFSAGCTPEMLDRQFNGGNVLVWGVEVAGSWLFEVGDFEVPVRGSYTYTGSSFRTDFESEDPTFGEVEEGDELPYVPEHQAQVQLGLQHRLAGMRLVGTYVAAMREQAGQGEPPPELRTDAQLLLGLVGWVHPIPENDEAKLYLRLQNLTNQQPLVSRRPFGARTIQPLSVSVGFEAGF